MKSNLLFLRTKITNGGETLATSYCTRARPDAQKEEIIVLGLEQLAQVDSVEELLS